MDRRSILFILLVSMSFLVVNFFFGPQQQAPKPKPQKVIEQPQKIEEPRQEVQDDNTPEKFYVLENDYVQLVFSNRGGALAEVNLPFEGDDNEHS